MEYVFLCIIIFLFVLAIFDLTVGVSNDAVNFMTSAVGSGAASFKRILIVASIGILIGAAMSNGMMDIARHGIFHPEQFSFYELLCIFVAVTVADIIILDVFNTLGMPTSTTVSIVFELLGATFVVSLIKIAGGDADLTLGQLLNTEKALSVTMGIFLSVAIAFVFGTVVQLLTRTIFSFDYRSQLKRKIGIFGGFCITAIIYFLLIKGAKGSVLIPPAALEWINAHTGLLIAGCFVASTLLMQLLHALKVNVLKVVVLTGTFALAMAFAGNDLVNFIGVPLTGLSAYQDYVANGSGDPDSFLMGSLNAPANTPFWFLLGAGVIMVVSLATSRKARNVTKTQIGLGSQSAGDELFGSSRIGRRLVRWSLSFIDWVHRVTPPRLRLWIDRRFNVDDSIIAHGASFDLVRASVNLVLAGTLIAIGTSLKLPLSTTFVTFMVAMGTSLADRAWSRESAVFRVTGVISVIGGWFITAGVAFIGAGLIVLLTYHGGIWAMAALAVLTALIVVRSNRRFKTKEADKAADTLFNAIIGCEDKEKTWPLLFVYIIDNQQRFLTFAANVYSRITEAFIGNDISALEKTGRELANEKDVLKAERRRETLCLRNVVRETAIEKSAWFYLSNNCCMSMLYNLRRIDEVCTEHIGNNFLPLPPSRVPDFRRVSGHVNELFAEALAVVSPSSQADVKALRRRCDAIKDEISVAYHSIHDQIREGDAKAMTVLYVYMNVLQETLEMVSSLRKYLRAFARMR